MSAPPKPTGFLLPEVPPAKPPCEAPVEFIEEKLAGFKFEKSVGFASSALSI